MVSSASRGSGPGAALTLLERLLVEHKPGYALAREFQTDPGLYQLDVERIWRRGWLFVGHTCEIKRPGDYVVFDIDADSLIVIRDDRGQLHALHNTCRHRGMKLCHTERGQARRLVCPYHQWTYGHDGALLACANMDSDGDLDRREFALHRAHLREVGGLIFASLAAEAPPFEEAAQALGPMLEPQGIDRAKIAAVRRYTVRANWKLVWENNRECWHCQVNHPQYVRANYDNAPADDPRLRVEIAARAADTSAHLRTAGLSIDYPAAGMAPFPAVGCWWSVNRTPLAPGWVTESMDGRPVAPLMGRYPTPDVGTLRVRAVPNFWSHASGDHVVSTRLAPAGPVATQVQVQWLVHEDAVEGQDYRLDTLLPFWEMTSEQDWWLCQQNHAGVSSPAFTPGPYSTKREYNVIRWTEWYLSEVARP